MSQTPGRAYGDRKLVQSPVSLEDLAKLKAPCCGAIRTMHC